MSNKIEPMHCKYFSDYVEKQQDSIPAQELVGTLKVHELNGNKAAFLYVTTDKDKYIRYDLPSFTMRYDNSIVAVIGRPYTKKVGEKTYNKLVVIRIRKLKSLGDKNEQA